MLVFFMHLIQKLDPDVLMTYDAERGSLMHIVHRASRYGWDFLDYVSRCPSSDKAAEFFANYCF